VATVTNGSFEWDAEKAAANLEKHGVAFEEAMTVLVSPETLELPDPTSLENVITIGFSATERVLLVVSCERSERTRIISARRATKHEAKAFNNR
jgi:uncharacterized DUF497 family protein